MPKLYTHPMSTFARRVHIALAEKSVSWEEEVVAMEKRAHRQEAYLAINPYGRVPSLVDEEGELRLIESTAILEYLELTHPEPALIPTDAALRAKVHMHIKLCDLQFTPHVGVIIFSKRFLPEARWRKDDMAAASAAIAKHVDILATHLSTREWLVGGAYSMADLCYAPFVQFMPMLDIDVPEPVTAWATRLLARDTVKSTQPADAPSWTT